MFIRCALIALALSAAAAHHDHHHEHPSAVDLSNYLGSKSEEHLGEWKLSSSWSAVAHFEGDVKGWVKFRCHGDKVLIRGEVRGLTPGLHGLHIHNNGDISNACTNVGPHYDPHETGKHGPPEDAEAHAGDLGNIKADSNGRAKFFLSSTVLQLEGQHTILGRSLGIDEHEDTFEHDHDDSVPPIACAVIQTYQRKQGPKKN